MPYFLETSHRRCNSTGKERQCCSALSLLAFSPPLLIITTSKLFAWCSWCSSANSGTNAWQGPHSVSEKTSKTRLPRNSARVRCSPARSGRVKSGAGVASGNPSRLMRLPATAKALALSSVPLLLRPPLEAVGTVSSREMSASAPDGEVARHATLRVEQVAGGSAASTVSLGNVPAFFQHHAAAPAVFLGQPSVLFRVATADQQHVRTVLGKLAKLLGHLEAEAA